MEIPTLDGLDVPIDVVDIPLFLNSWYFFAEISFVERYSYNVYAYVLPGHSDASFAV